MTTHTDPDAGGREMARREIDRAARHAEAQALFDRLPLKQRQEILDRLLLYLVTRPSSARRGAP